MEMNNRRWAMLVVLSCAALAALKLPPKERPRWLDWEYRARRVTQATIASNLNRRLMDLDEMATLIARRDSLLSAARPQSARTTPLVLASARVPERDRQQIEKAAGDHLRAIARNASSLLVFVAADTAGSTPRGLNYRTDRQFILPSATDGEKCITIVRLGRGRREMDAENIAGILGPCAFYAAFGPPGPAVEAWLRERGYDIAMDSRWPASADSNPGMLVPRRRTRQEDLARWLDLSRYYRLLDVTACSSGDRESCAKSFRTSTVRRTASLPEGLIIQRLRWEWDSGLGPATSTFLADLLAAKGPENFARFWRSSAKPDAAFTEAFGESPGDWMMRWMRYRYGTDQRGPHITSSSALLSVLTSVTLVGLCAALSTRRQTE